jgi:phenylalanyl-tRNA synthetase alpha chain
MLDLTIEAKRIESELTTAISSAKSINEVEAVRLKFLGREGLIPALMKSLKDISAEEKRVVGPALNQLRETATSILQEAKIRIETESADAANQKKTNFDVTATLPKTKPKGSRHIYTKFLEEIEDIFISMGLSVFDGPEVETDFYNFGALNIPEDHPARDMYDTFWIDPGKRLLRTHTSTIQIHAMQKYGVPIAGIAPGRVYRHEAVDATHDAMFTQCEGLVVDKGINMSHLLGTMKTFLGKMFESKKIEIRVRPGFFPFVEPGLEIDMSCIFCDKGCSICKKTKWIELCGAGMVHPNVLRAVNVDPDVYSGFAFGFGVERLAMLRYGIDDVRHFHAGRIKFLEQF